MGKFCGKIGFSKTIETSPGVWEEQITEHNCRGDITRSFRKNEQTGQLNDNISLSNELSIIADPFVTSCLGSIRYVTYMGVKWKVNSAEVQYPRLILSIGGVYNDRKGPQDGAT